MDTATDKQIAFLAKNGVKVSFNMSKQEASQMIDEIISKKNPNSKVIDEPQKEHVIYEKPGYTKPKFDNTSYYVSYAKDICVALIDALQGSETPLNKIMDDAIECVKKAREAFS